MILSVIYPMGDNSYYVINAAMLARAAAYKVEWANFYNLCYIFWIMQIIMFCLYRACLGAYFITSLRYKLDVDTLWKGFAVYVVDLFGPIVYIWKVATMKERMNGRRTAYCLVSISLRYCEWSSARGFFIVCFFLTCFDLAVVGSHFGKVTHQLGMRVNYNGIAFEQENALPWFSGDKLAEAMASTGKLVVERANGTVSGLAFMMKRGKRCMLYTVKHMTNGKVPACKFNGKAYTNLKFAATGKGDSVVKAEFEDDSLFGAEVDLLTKDELPSLDKLLFVGKDDDGEAMACYVTNFEVKKDKLYASVNLKKGDSGGPVFGILKEGYFRYVGAVSKGNYNSGGGNIISLVFGDVEDISDDDKSLGDVKEFNNARKMVKFDMRGLHRKSVEALNKFFEEFKDPSNDYCVDIVPTRDEIMNIKIDDLVEKHVGLVFPKIDVADDERDGSDGEDEGGGHRRQNKQKDKKARNKDKAARKRGYLMLRSISLAMEAVYDEGIIEPLFRQVAKRNIPKVSGVQCVAWSDAHGMFIVDDDPSNVRPVAGF